MNHDELGQLLPLTDGVLEGVAVILVTEGDDGDVGSDFLVNLQDGVVTMLEGSASASLVFALEFLGDMIEFYQSNVSNTVKYIYIYIAWTVALGWVIYFLCTKLAVVIMKGYWLYGTGSGIFVANSYNGATIVCSTW